MVELFEQDERQNNRQSSKGNQLKWNNNGIWYKTDYTGYEGLAEYMISHLLLKSSLRQDEFVLYEPEQIRYKDAVYSGVKSNDFLEKDWQLITLERLFMTFFGQSLYQSIFKISDPEKRLIFLVEQVERVTNLSDFGVYMNKLFTMDAFFLNEDRHTHNIAILMNKDGRFSYSPIFDNGAGLLADTSLDYPLGKDVYLQIKEVRAKTISADFDEQLDLSEKLYGNHLKFHFHAKDVSDLLDGISIYSQEEKDRVRDILLSQMKKYAYLFDEKQPLL
ncbi:MAG TPA: hypothetical protein DFI63_00510 [Lachnospiraceae bacterium]|nr:hypothetical protein [Lachnospiraceae bacterium]